MHWSFSPTRPISRSRSYPYVFFCILSGFVCCYGRPLSVSGRPCYILPMFIYLFIYLWPPYSPALVNGGSRKFYTWWTLSVIREVTTWIFSWSSLNNRVGQKWRNLPYFQTPPANFLLSRPNAAEYCNSEKKLVKHRWCLYNVCHVWWTLAYKPLRSTRHKLLKKWHAWIACDMSYFRLLDASTTTPEPLNLNPLAP